MKRYGKEVILDIHNCNVSKFNRKDIKKYIIQLCDLIDMQREDLNWWDYKGYPEEYAKAPDHLKGTSCVQFIKTSNITIHTIDPMKKIFINIFSCKNFSGTKAAKFSADWFNGKIVSFAEIS